MIILLALVVQAHASELGATATNYNPELQDAVKDKIVRNLLTRAHNISSNVAVDDTTLGKPSNLAISPTPIKAPVLQTRAFARSAFNPQFHGRGTPGQLAFNKDTVRKLQQYICPSACARGSTIVKSSQAEYDKMVDENRMITVQESQIRYAGAFAVFLGLVKSYIEMQGAGVYDYNQIAAGAAGAFLLFESARRSF